MWQDDQIDALVVLVAGLDRAAVSQHIQAYPARFPIDFTDEYLDRQPTERLKHLLVAMCLTHKQIPRDLMDLSEPQSPSCSRNRVSNSFGAVAART